MPRAEISRSSKCVKLSATPLSFQPCTEWDSWFSQQSLVVLLAFPKTSVLSASLIRLSSMLRGSKCSLTRDGCQSYPCQKSDWPTRAMKVLRPSSINSTDMISVRAFLNNEIRFLWLSSKSLLYSIQHLKPSIDIDFHPEPPSNLKWLLRILHPNFLIYTTFSKVND